MKSLVAHGKRSDSNSVKAIHAIKDIKNALLQYRSEQYTSNWYNITSYFKSNPAKVTQEIDPAILKVNNALKELQSNVSVYGYVKAGALATIVAVMGTVALSLKRLSLDLQEIKRARIFGKLNFST